LNVMSKKPHILIAEARFYEPISDMLADGAITALKKVGATYDRIVVPGAMELTSAIKLAADQQKYDAYVALGCIIRGETYHFEIVANESARGLTWLAIEPGLIIGNGILTCENYEQAEARADRKKQDKGGHAVKAALALLDIKNG
jgi:6,7-dimethyl-8-ribityllumazine synthase